MISKIVMDTHVVGEGEASAILHCQYMNMKTEQKKHSHKQKTRKITYQQLRNGRNLGLHSVLGHESGFVAVLREERLQGVQVLRVNERVIIVLARFFAR